MWLKYKNASAKFLIQQASTHKFNVDVESSTFEMYYVYTYLYVYTGVVL